MKQQPVKVYNVNGKIIVRPVKAGTRAEPDSGKCVAATIEPMPKHDSWKEYFAHD